MYHQVAPPAPRGTQFRGLTVHPSSFRRQMTWMKRLGYQGLSMRDLTPYLRGERRGKVFGITFDDGFSNVFENALPVLSELGFTSTNYFVANQFGGSNVWDQDKNIPFAALMSAQQVRAWQLLVKRWGRIHWIMCICRRSRRKRHGGRLGSPRRSCRKSLGVM